MLDSEPGDRRIGQCVSLLYYMFDHLDEAEPAEGRVVAGEDHHDGPALQAGHTAAFSTACRLGGLLGH